MFLFFVTVTELGHSKIVSFKPMSLMSSIGFFDFYMWTVNIYVEANFTRCTKSPTAYTRKSNQYPCHLSNTQKKKFIQQELKAENCKKGYLF